MNAVLATFGACFAALLRPQTPLVKAIRLVLAIKLIAIAAIGGIMVAGLKPHGIDAGAMSRLIGPSSSASSQRGR